MEWIIYCHLNKINGKRYIGLTRNSLQRRTGLGTGYHKKVQEVFAAAIKKYGWENFEHIILESNIQSLKEAKKREKYWIAYYHTWVHDPECNGYNMTEGGDNTGQMNYTTVMKGTEYKKILLTELDQYIAAGWHKTLHNEKWNLEHQKELKEYQTKYRQIPDAKKRHYEHNKKYNEAHKEEIKEYMKKYREEHKKENKEYMKNYHATHKDTRDRREYQKQYYQRKKHKNKDGE